MARKNNSIHIYYQNTRGLRTKSSEFFRNVVCSEFSAIVICETWLCNDISSCDYFPPSYKIFRSDRERTGPKQKGGGVLIAIDCSFQCVRRSDLESQHETVWLEVCLAKGEKLLIGAFYIAPDVSPSEFNETLTSIENISNLHSKHKLIVLGDFNTPGIRWNNLSFEHKNHYAAQKCNMLLDFVSFTSMQQFCRIENACGNVLDVCFSNLDNVQVCPSDIALVHPDKFHPPLLVSLSVAVQHRHGGVDDCDLPRYAFKRGDYAGLYHFYSSANWSSVFEHSDVDEQVRRFTEIVRSGMNKYIPTYKPVQSKYPPRFSKELRSSLKLKDSAHKKAKRSGLVRWKAEFSHFRALCKSLYQRDHQLYIESLEAAASQQPADFWMYMRRRSKASKKILTYLTPTANRFRMSPPVSLNIFILFLNRLALTIIANRLAECLIPLQLC